MSLSATCSSLVQGKEGAATAAVAEANPHYCYQVLLLSENNYYISTIR